MLRAEGKGVGEGYCGGRGGGEVGHMAWARQVIRYRAWQGRGRGVARRLRVENEVEAEELEARG